jgi:retron-type reverse transcriptase
MNILSRLSHKLKTTEQDIVRVVASAPLKYKVYTIPKRTQGRRTIAHPSKDLKEVQRALLELLTFPVHSNAMAYRKGFSIKDNAAFHKNNQYLLKMDFENFFNSITPDIFWNSWKQHWIEPESLDKRVIENIIFWAKHKPDRSSLALSVGAPSSPTISNFCLYQFDTVLTNHCIENGIHFTRYADDLTFSTNQKNSLFTVPELVANTLKEIYGTRLTINHQKTVFTSKAHNKHVTGITITPQGQLSVGRSRKRYIKHLVHQYTLGNLDESDLNHLRGLISFAMHIEPKFLILLFNKYSKQTVTEILRGHNEQE